VLAPTAWVFRGIEEGKRRCGPWFSEWWKPRSW
jgi:hypothetical protein